MSDELFSLSGFSRESLAPDFTGEREREKKLRQTRAKMFSCNLSLCVLSLCQLCVWIEMSGPC